MQLQTPLHRRTRHQRPLCLSQHQQPHQRRRPQRCHSLRRQPFRDARSALPVEIARMRTSTLPANSAATGSTARVSANAAAARATRCAWFRTTRATARRSESTAIAIERTALDRRGEPRSESAWLWSSAVLAAAACGARVRAPGQVTTRRRWYTPRRR